MIVTSVQKPLKDFLQLLTTLAKPPDAISGPHTKEINASSAICLQDMSRAAEPSNLARHCPTALHELPKRCASGIQRASCVPCDRLAGPGLPSGALQTHQTTSLRYRHPR